MSDNYGTIISDIDMDIRSMFVFLIKFWIANLLAMLFVGGIVALLFFGLASLGEAG